MKITPSPLTGWADTCVDQQSGQIGFGGCVPPVTRTAPVQQQLSTKAPAVVRGVVVGDRLARKPLYEFVVGDIDGHRRLSPFRWRASCRSPAGSLGG